MVKQKKAVKAKVKKDATIKEKVMDYFYVSGLMFFIEVMTAVPLYFTKSYMSPAVFNLYGMIAMFVLFFLGGMLYSKRFEEISYMDISLILAVKLLRSVRGIDVSLIITVLIVFSIFMAGIKTGYAFFDKKYGKQI